MPRKMPTLEEFVLRALVFLILAGAFATAFPYLSDIFDFRQPTVEVSGLRPGEKIVIGRQTLTFYRLEATADEKGRAIFNNVPLGNWAVIEGGTLKLQKTVIPVQERFGSLQRGTVKVFFY